jgi:predicted nucleic acid-binding protein
MIQSVTNSSTALLRTPDLLVDGQALGNLVTDAHLAALALQHGRELLSTDAGFARFAKLRWTNPLTAA